MINVIIVGSICFALGIIIGGSPICMSVLKIIGETIVDKFKLLKNKILSK